MIRGTGSLRRVRIERYILRRLVFAVVLTVVALTINFLIIHLAPGDPVAILAGETGGGADYYEEMRHRLGLDRPLLEQYARFVSSALAGDLGTSIAYRAPVMDVILSRLGPTLLLMIPSILIASVLGIVLGVSAGQRAGSLTDDGLSILSLLGASIPSFWLGQLLVLLFAVHLGLLPVQGIVNARTQLEGWDLLADVARHTVLPVATLSLVHFTLIARLVRTSIRDVSRTNYIRTAYAKGLPRRRIWYRHGLRNALLPVVTVIGSQFGSVLSGAVLVETIFAWPGIGRLLYESTLARDYPVLLGILFVVSVGIALANLLTDLTYLLLDPRVEYR
ncbi:MAG: ABC transporter permease [Pseudaminobacter sp.]